SSARPPAASSERAANWVRYSSAYRPPASSSSSCVPRSTIRPASSTRIRSAARTVDSRCAITIAVRSARASVSASWTAASEVLSRWAVASSSTTTRWRASSSRAIVMLPQYESLGGPPAFPAGQAVAAFPDHRAQAVGQGPDEVLQAGPAQGVEEVGLGGVGPGEQQVGAHRVVEEVAVLGDHADGGAQRGGGQVPDVDAADADGARVDVVQAGQRLRDGGLARAGGADEGDGPAGLRAEGDAVQDLGAPARVQGGDLLQGGEGDLVGGRVAEPDVELDGHRAVGHHARRGLLLDQRAQVQHLEDALEADQRAHHL